MNLCAHKRANWQLTRNAEQLYRHDVYTAAPRYITLSSSTDMMHIQQQQCNAMYWTATPCDADHPKPLTARLLDSKQDSTPHGKLSSSAPGTACDAQSNARCCRTSKDRMHRVSEVAAVTCCPGCTAGNDAGCLTAAAGGSWCTTFCSSRSDTAGWHNCAQIVRRCALLQGSQQLKEQLV